MKLILDLAFCFLLLWSSFGLIVTLHEIYKNYNDIYNR